MQKTCPTAFLVTCLLAISTVTGKSENFGLIEQNFDNKRISTAAFPQDSQLGISEILDPELSRAIGSRGLKIWTEGQNLNNVDYYLRVSKNKRDLLNSSLNLASFNNNTYEDAITALKEAWVLQPFLRTIIPNYDQLAAQWNELEENELINRFLPPVDLIESIALATTPNAWDYLYEQLCDCSAQGISGSYRSSRMSRLREYFLKSKYDINARFLYWPGYPEVIKEFVIKATENNQSGTAKTFIFDSDPFAFQYRRHKHHRVIQHLTNAQDGTSYQWVRVEGNGITYGDVHEIELPRPLNIAVCGDSFTSGEAAPLNNMWDYPKWIQEYSGRQSHRSVNSGWEKAVNETVKSRFTDMAVNLYNVSWSGAKIREYNRQGPTDENEINLFPGLNGPLNTAARQMHALDSIMHDDEQDIVDILGFTFGGNDAKFSKIIEVMLVKDADDGDYGLHDIGTKEPFVKDEDAEALDIIPKEFPIMGNFDQMWNHGKTNLRWFGESLNNEAFDLKINKVICGNYPNPLGGMDEYAPSALAIANHAALSVWESCREGGDPPLWLSIITLGIADAVVNIGCAVAGIGTWVAAGLAQAIFDAAAEIDSDEIGWVQNIIMPAINDAMVTANADQFSYILADTFDRLAMDHNHHIEASHRWFEPISTLDTEDSEFAFAFHPNTIGHENIYKPIYLAAVTDCLNAGIRKSTYNRESDDWDLDLSTANLVYHSEDSTLRLEGFVTNRSITKTSHEATVDILTLFGRPNDHGWLSDSFSSPLKDVNGNTIVIPELEPGLSFILSFVLERGPEECVYHELILSHFLELQDQEHVREYIGNVYDVDTLAARLAAWPTLFGQNLIYAFQVNAIDEYEYHTINNTAPTHGLIEANIQDLITWLRKNHKLLHAEMTERAKSSGVNSLTELSNQLLKERPELINIFRIKPNSGWDRNSIPQKTQLSDLLWIAERVRLPRKIGILDPELTLLGKEAAADEITLKLPSREVRIGIDQFHEIPEMLPSDGVDVSAIFHQALSYNAEDPEKRERRQFVDHTTLIQATHKYTGLANFSSGARVLEENTINVDLQFPPEIGNPATNNFSRWQLIDPATGAKFVGKLEIKSNQATDIDLSRFLFHTNMVQVNVTSFHKGGERSTGYNFFTDTPKGTVQQKFDARSGSNLLVELTITGDCAEELAEGINVLITSDDGVPLLYMTQPEKIEFVQLANDLSCTKFIIPIPLDFVNSGMRIVQLTSITHPEKSLITSLHLSALHPYLPSTLQAAHSSVEMEVLSDKEVVVRSSNAGLLMIDITEDFQVWRRALTTMIDGNAPYNFAMPPSYSNKLFLRARMMKAQ